MEDENFLGEINLRLAAPKGPINLINYVNSHDDWQTSLKKPPYNFKTVRNDPDNPTHWIFVYNLFDSDFTNPVVKEARGIVLDIQNGQVVGIVSHAFDKFFNWGDPNAADIDWSSAIVQEKLDGQLVRVSRYNDKLYWFTNGSFGLNTPVDYTDDRVKNYQDLMNIALGDDLSWLGNVSNGETVIFELTSRYNHIIVDYDEPKLTLLGMYADTLLPKGDKYTVIRHAFNAENAKKILGCPYDIPKTYDAHNFDEVKEMLSKFEGKTNEGVVVLDKYDNRVKIKCDDYLRIKYLLGENGITDDRLLIAVLNNEEDDLIEIGASDIVQRIDAMKKRVADFNQCVESYFAKARAKFAETNNARNEYAKWALAQPEKNMWFDLIKYDNVQMYIANVWRHIKMTKHAYDEFINNTLYKFVKENE